MLDRFRWQHGWSVFAVAIPIASVVILISLLTFAWGFDVETSPARQLGVHYLMLALLLAMTFVMASYRLSGFGERFLGAMLLAAVLAPVAVFAAHWVVGGPYGGFRDPRIFEVVVTSVSSFVLIWVSAVFPRSFFMLGRDLVQTWRHELPREGGLDSHGRRESDQPGSCGPA